MTVGYPQEEQIYESPMDYIPRMPSNSAPIRIDPFSITLLLILIFLIIQLFPDRDKTSETAIPQPQTAEQSEGEEAEPIPETIGEAADPAPVAPVIPDPATIAYPYDEYWVTQGPHGMSYGHMAIDLAAGKGAAVKSPIFGTVTANYIDVYGNTTLVIENERYQVTILHGDFSAVVGQGLWLGDTVGVESNNGYTLDMYGNSCRGRDCGYHTHLNVYDKSLGQNVNPLDVLKA